MACSFLTTAVFIFLMNCSAVFLNDLVDHDDSAIAHSSSRPAGPQFTEVNYGRNLIQIREAAAIFEAALIAAANARSISSFLAIIENGTESESNSIANSTDASNSTDPLRDAVMNADLIASQAVCEPRTVLIDLDTVEYTPKGAAYFPSCIEVKRCGGSCGLSGLVDCRPSNYTFKDVYRAKVKPSESDKQIPGQLQVLSIEEHHSCECACRVQAVDCIPLIHRYRKELCRCECVNAVQQEIACASYPWKRWDSSDCTCKCLTTRRCGRAMVWSHETCRCEYFENLPLN